ncbi:MAG: hypothetical protein KF858_10835 [Candidatus Sumerlaeia bacterium]|nr:hypothetical protein [Candidatus Sumerlaeia bacterium]
MRTLADYESMETGEFLRLLEENPTDGMHLAYLGAHDCRDGVAEYLIESLKRADLPPEYVEAAIRKVSTCYMARQRPEGAFELLVRAALEDPTRWNIVHSLATAPVERQADVVATYKSLLLSRGAELPDTVLGKIATYFAERRVVDREVSAAAARLTSSPSRAGRLHARMLHLSALEPEARAAYLYEAQKERPAKQADILEAVAYVWMHAGGVDERTLLTPGEQEVLRTAAMRAFRACTLELPPSDEEYLSAYGIALSAMTREYKAVDPEQGDGVYLLSGTSESHKAALEAAAKDFPEGQKAKVIAAALEWLPGLIEPR